MNSFKIPVIITLILTLSSAKLAEALSSGTKLLEYKDKVYEENIKTVMMFSGADPIGAAPGVAAISLIQPVPLVLKFDEINTDNADYYKARIIHCHFNWTPSHLADQQYLFEYNEFPIEQYEFSVATKVHYTHFTFALPRLRLPGNYLLVVYRDQDIKDIIISRRFVVYDQRVKISSEGAMPGMGMRKSSQLISFSIDYKGLPVSNPFLDIKVAMRQNQRWDNAIFGIQPTMVRDDLSQMEFRHFDLENTFLAGNEFRFFDLRSIHYGGRNVDKITIGKTKIDGFLYLDKSRGTEAYALNKDLNGGFFIENTESGNDLLEAEYINTYFFLDLKGRTSGDLYVAGRLTDWGYSKANKMEFVESSGLYSCRILLKQGLYDFIYYMPDNKENPYALEGSHFETNNEYEILVYFKDPLLNTDVPVGYVQLF